MAFALHAFDARRHEPALVAIIDAVRAHRGPLDDRSLSKILCAYPKEGRGAFSKSEIIRGFRALAPDKGWDDESAIVDRLRMKPVRTSSGVAPVTVLTRPFPCPGRCVFCPSDVRMPKSYLAREPGAQRAEQHAFDPYAQTLGRLFALHHNGHAVDKVELIVLGGTWSSYPEDYQRWFVTRCFDALNDFGALRSASDRGEAIDLPTPAAAPASTGAVVPGDPTNSYNQVVSRDGRGKTRDEESRTWADVAAAHRCNERAAARCVGLVLETRPDCVDLDETRRLRRLGATKVQLGLQSLDDDVLAANRRGHDVETSRRAMTLLRAAGFKIHAHWMPNLLGSDPDRDRVDFARLFDDPAVRPDELKIYPCSLVETADLVTFHQRGEWRPYRDEELRELLADCLLQVPPYCRVTRVIRDIPGDEILVGNRTTNLRQVVAEDLAKRGEASRDIRAREIGRTPFTSAAAELVSLSYGTGVGEERFLQWVVDGDRLAGFCRLSLPSAESPIEELGRAAVLREVHVYGGLVGFDAGEDAGAQAQHRGLGRRLVETAATMARDANFTSLAVISAVGTRDYYRRLGFVDGDAYQHRDLISDRDHPALRMASAVLRA